MILTIINHDNTSKVLHYDDKSEFVQQCKKDEKHLLNAVIALSPGYKTFTTKEVPGGVVINSHANIAEKLTKKMRIKNSFQTSKDMFLMFASKSKLSNMFNGSVSSVKLSTQFGTLLAN